MSAGPAGERAESGGAKSGGRPPAPRPRRGDYRHMSALATRWMDNDVYGHVNNVVYYSFFDTAVNRYLIERGALDMAGGGVIGLVVETRCRYFAPIAFPDCVSVGLNVAHMGRSSVRYDLAVFAGDGDAAAAQGHFVHVYVARAGRRPVKALSEALRAALAPLYVGG